MATITSTELEVYLGSTSSGGTLVGTKITKQGSPSQICMNSDPTSLGVALSPGTQYCARVRCTNSDQYTTEWRPDYAFRTLILAEIESITIGCGDINVVGDLTYDNNDSNIGVTECGIYVSTAADGTNPTKITIPEQDFVDEHGYDVSTLNEHTKYYAVPFALDQDNREYVGEWINAERFTTKWNAPVITISNVATTYNNITGNINISTNDSGITNVRLVIQPTGGGTAWTKNLTASTGTQTFSITNGDTADSSTPAGQTTIVINPSTEYRITVYATNVETGGCTGSQQATATTAQQQTSTIDIRSITNITPTSACANLIYDNNNGGQTQGGSQNE